MALIRRIGELARTMYESPSQPAEQQAVRMMLSTKWTELRECAVDVAAQIRTGHDISILAERITREEPR